MPWLLWILRRRMGKNKKNHTAHFHIPQRAKNIKATGRVPGTVMVCATELGGTCNGALKGIAGDQRHQHHLFRSEGKQSQGSSQPPLSESAFPVTCAGQDRQGCSEIPPPLRGGRQINCLTIPSGQSCMLLAWDLTNRPLSQCSARHLPLE